MVRATSRLVAAAVIIGVLVGLPITEAQAQAQPSGNWPTYLYNGPRTGYDGSEKIITSSTARKLTRLWVHATGRPISTQPIRVNGVVYYGSWSGYERAVDAASGAQRWAAFLGVTTDRRCAPSIGVASTAVVGTIKVHGIATRAVFVGGGDGNFYALNASTGRKIWKTRLGRPPGYFLWSSPLLYRGSIYEGVGSFADCPLVRGGMVRINAATGAVKSKFYTVPPGCTGADVWGSPAVDTATGDIYFATGNAGSCQKRETLAVAVIRTDASLKRLGSWRVPSAKLPNHDSDFGSTPTLFSASIGGVVHSMVGIQNKNGIYYAFKRYDISRGPLWQDRVARSGNCPECGKGGISPSAYNGHLLFIGGEKTRIGHAICAGSIRAVRPSTGKVVWADCLRSGPVLGAVTAVPGLAFVDAGNTVYAVGTNRGTIVWSYKDKHGGSRFWGAPTVSGGRVYVGNQDGRLYAFGI